MITPEEIRARAIKLWNSQKVFRAHLSGSSIFPWEILLPQVRAQALTSGFCRAQERIRILKKGAKETVGFGYRVESQRVNYRSLGDQSIPHRIVVDSLDDFLRLTEKNSDFQSFTETSSKILVAQPELKPLLVRKPSLVLEHVGEWERLLAVCRFFQEHPLPGLYARQLEIHGVDTKFIGNRRALLSELLDLLLLPEAKISNITGLADHGFERRFGLRVEAPVIRFRLLDPDLTLNGLRDIGATLTEFASLSLPVHRVFITENKMNGLCFPECPNAVVLFGLGYGAGCLVNIPWLRKVPIHYWGDIDTHGFAILDHLREIFPAMKSFLMNEKTLLSFRELWVREGPTKRFMKDLGRLTPEEAALFRLLRNNVLGESIRLEQERVAFSHVCQAVAEIASNS